MQHEPLRPRLPPAHPARTVLVYRTPGFALAKKQRHGARLSNGKRSEGRRRERHRNSCRERGTKELGSMREHVNNMDDQRVHPQDHPKRRHLLAIFLSRLPREGLRRIGRRPRQGRHKGQRRVMKITAPGGAEKAQEARRRGRPRRNTSLRKRFREGLRQRHLRRNEAGPGLLRSRG